MSRIEKKALTKLREKFEQETDCFAHEGSRQSVFFDLIFPPCQRQAFLRDNCGFKSVFYRLLHG